MIKVNNLEIFGLKSAVYGMRLPLRSHHKADTIEDTTLGDNDLDLAKRLIKAGTEHRKFLRQIHITMNITAPMYWYKEADTYKVGTTANSSSYMHMAMKRPFEANDFSFEDVNEAYVEDLLEMLNLGMNYYNNAKDKTNKEEMWRGILQIVPQSYNYERIITCNMEVLYNMYNQRKTHKLKEWREFCQHLEQNELFKQLFLEQD